MKLVRSLSAVAAGLAAAASLAGAQGTGTISGRVLSEAGAPLPSASVAIRGLGLGAYTDASGRYRINVPATQLTGQTVTITARRVGYLPKSLQLRLSAGLNIQQDFQLSAAPTQLSGVVVTALGIQKKKSQLGTAVQQVSSEELNATHDPNVVNELQGKVSGVSITGSGTQGGSTKITIRGSNSITGNNDPLFIVDGTPISNSDQGGNVVGGGFSSSGAYYNTSDFGSAIGDIDPNDIATVTVLKGPNAAALYGSRAANGVILITTKHGAASGGKVQTTITSNYTWDTPAILPTFQNQYGQGSGGTFAFVDGAGGGIQDFNDQSFGPKLDGRLITQFNSPVGPDGKLVPIPWVAHPNNIKDFFNTGRTFSNNIAFSGGTERANARLSIGSDQVTGVIPNNTFHKFSGDLAANLTVSSRLSASSNIQYITNKAYNRPGVGYNTGILEGLYVWFGRQVDMNALRDYHTRPNQTFDCNKQFNWNCNYHNNPFWWQYENPEADNRDRLIASGSATYKVTDWLNATLRSGTDYSRYNINQDFAAGNIQDGIDPSYNGAMYLYNNRNNENNTELLLTANKQAGSHLQLSGAFGGNRRYATYSSNSLATRALLASGIYNVSNSATAPTTNQYDERRQVNSVYGSGSFTLNNYWTVEVTGRNDWSSTLPKGNNSYFYPSINTSLVLTDLIPALRNRVLNYAKIRGSVAQVGNDAAPYQLATTYTGLANKFNGLPQYTLGDLLANANLRPEQTKSGEVGLELGFFNNRATLDATYYGKATTNEIVNITLAPETGFNQAALNAGKMTNYGVEAQLTLVPIRTQNFEWTSTFNYSANRSKLVSLYPGLTNYILGSNGWGVTTEARVGQPYGVLVGYPFARDSAGNQLTDGGLPVTDFSHRRVLGNINPKWIGGWNNQIRLGRFTASALLDIHRGGQIYSVTNMFGQYTGVLASTLNGRQVDWNKPGLVVKGIDVNTGKPNTDTVTAENYYQSMFENGQAYLYDDSFIKLREVRVGVDLPPSVTNFFHASAVNLAFVGRNLWTSTKVPNIDPEFTYGTGNYQGSEFAALPTTRSLGLNLRITP